MITLPPYPDPLPVGYTPEQRAAYEDARNRYNDQVRAKQADEQARTASAIEAMISLMNSPVDKAMIAWELYKAHPHVTGLTDLNVIDACAKAADSWLSRFPPTP